MARILMSCIFVCVIGYASDAYGYSGGSGSPYDPFLISTPQDWQMLCNSPNDVNAGNSFVLTNDLTFPASLLLKLAPALRHLTAPSTAVATPFTASSSPPQPTSIADFSGISVPLAMFIILTYMPLPSPQYPARVSIWAASPATMKARLADALLQAGHIMRDTLIWLEGLSAETMASLSIVHSQAI